MDLPTIGHLFYIPGVLLVGLALGFRFGAKSVRTEYERERRKRKQ